MCGFTGILKLDRSSVDPRLLERMNTSLRHRGPDDEGYLFLNSEKDLIKNCFGEETMPSLKASLSEIDSSFPADLGFGFRRLSIIDLSEHGHQPMCDISQRYWIVFNGEIYNFPEIRTELMADGIKFMSGSDTEVILYAYQTWGEKCVNRFNGMWAFAIYDRLEKKMFCSRDRFGIKPFYYIYEPGKLFAFASEIKSLLYLVQFVPDYGMIREYFVTGVTSHTKQTFFKGILQLQAGYNLSIQNGQLNCLNYYKPDPPKSNLSFNEACEKFKFLLEDSITLRQRSDVPYGYALSGGIDSSSIVCAAKELNKGDSDMTFSLVFPGKKEDESDYIRSVVDHTGFRSKYVTIGPDDLVKDLEKFVFHQEEPFGGISYYGEFKLRELIRNSGVTVSLEGQGADEIVTGYGSLIPYYFYDLIKNLNFGQLRKEVAAFRPMTGLNMNQVLRSFVSNQLDRQSQVHLQKYPYVNWNFLNTFKSHEVKNNNLTKSGTFLDSELNKMLFVTSIPEQLLRADKSAMTFSVESRFPYLDWRLVEFAMGLPYQFKIRNGTTKYILRESMKHLLPEKIYLRKDKIGFAVPADQWVNDSLWKKLNEYLDSDTLENLVDKKTFKKMYPEKEAIDWKFWKTISLILWKNEFESFHRGIIDKLNT